MNIEQSGFRAVQDVLATVNQGWPEPGSPYHQLILAEIGDPSFVHMGSLPGVLLDTDAAAILSTNGTPEDAAQIQKHAVLEARTRLYDWRTAYDSNFSAELLLSSDYLDPVQQIAPHRAAAQVVRLLDAIDGGLQVRMVGARQTANNLPQNTRSVILAGPGPAVLPRGVYWESPDPAQEPHETWKTDDTARSNGTLLYRRLSAVAMSIEGTSIYLGEQLKDINKTGAV